MPKPIQIPFESKDFRWKKKGDLMHFGGGYKPYEYADWRANYEFEATLQFLKFCKGSSSVNAALIDVATGNKYNMFLSHFREFCLNSKVEKGLLQGKFTFCKRGQYYGIRGVF